MLDPAHPWHKVAASGYPHAQSMQWPALIERIEAPTPLSVRFVLKRPDATFLATLSMGFASIYSAEYAAKLLADGTPEKLNAQPVGTGPFVLKRFQKDAVIRYAANPDYFAGKPAVDPPDVRHYPRRQRAPAEAQTRRMPDCPVAETSGCAGSAC